MRAYIAQVSNTTQNQPNSVQNNEVPVIGNGGAGVAIAIFSALLTKFVNWGELAKQFAGTRTSKVLMSENRKTQELEGEIDINTGMSTTLSEIAKQGVANSADSVKELLHLLKESVEASTAHSKSSELLVEAKKHHAEATADIAKAMLHVAEALESLTEAQKLIPQEITQINKIYFGEIHVALNNIDSRLGEIVKELKEHDQAIEQRINLAETRIMEQFTGVAAQLRRDFAQLKCEQK